ncbi:DUF2523 family protein [Massilia sp. NR 4-1]|uniref:DUF2523 family protein n=1 Tax=Massilia sp. NR 4-1 TaxID=1678028 RepID=UPI00067B3681|nr:DUF2523 family protein [Massilia sp. NR 4-1]AKU20993.1 hypothetical protein ACZ75_05270 [Massilia sp. NR 4-1]
MFGIMLSALFSALGFLLRSVIVKFFAFFALFFITTEFVELLVPMLPGASSLTSAFAAQAPGVWYFIDLFRVDVGITACLSAFVTRFIIRRIPVIG